MENATKALLIAAAVLVAILIISLGIGVFNMASESMADADLSEYEVKEFNQKFTQYVGEKQRGSKVNALLETVFNHNLTETDAAKKITVYYVDTKATKSTYLKSTATTPALDVDTGKIYKVEATYSKTTALITSITITQQK